MRLAVLTALLLVACGGGPPPGHPAGGDTPAPEAITVVEVAPVERGAVADVLVTSAVVESEAQADLLPVATGIVRAIHAEEGDAVREGDVLAVIDNVSLEAGAERATAELARQEEELARLETLFAQGAVSERELTEARYRLDTARTTAREARRSEGQTRITAPFDGVVAARDIRLGELASSGSRAFQVVDLARLRVVAALPERDVSRVRVGQPARLVSAYDPSVGATGSVERIAPVIDPGTGTFRVTIALDPGQGALRPGQYVSVHLEVDRRTDVVVVPRQALAWEDGLPVVYRMVEKSPEEDTDAAEPEQVASGWSWPWAAEAAQADDTDAEEPEVTFVADRVLLEVGLLDTERVEVVKGVVPGDEVVVVGQSNLKEGARIVTPAMKAELDRKRAADADADGAEG